MEYTRWASGRKWYGYTLFWRLSWRDLTCSNNRLLLYFLDDCFSLISSSSVLSAFLRSLFAFGWLAELIFSRMVAWQKEKKRVCGSSERTMEGTYELGLKRIDFLLDSILLLLICHLVGFPAGEKEDSFLRRVLFLTCRNGFVRPVSYRYFSLWARGIGLGLGSRHCFFPRGWMGSERRWMCKEYAKTDKFQENKLGNDRAKERKRVSGIFFLQQINNVVQSPLEHKLSVQFFYFLRTLIVKLEIFFVFFFDCSFFWFGFPFEIWAYHNAACWSFCWAGITKFFFWRDEDVRYLSFFA